MLPEASLRLRALPLLLAPLVALAALPPDPVPALALSLDAAHACEGLSYVRVRLTNRSTAPVWLLGPVPTLPDAVPLHPVAPGEAKVTVTATPCGPAPGCRYTEASTYRRTPGGAHPGEAIAPGASVVRDVIAPVLPHAAERWDVDVALTAYARVDAEGIDAAVPLRARRAFRLREVSPGCRVGAPEGP